MQRTKLQNFIFTAIMAFIMAVGAIDFSPMVIAIVLLFLNNLFYDYFQVLWAIAA